MRIAVTSHILAGTGYGEYARLIAWALHETGHNLRTRKCQAWAERPERLGHKGELVCSRLGHDLDKPVDLSLIIHLAKSFHTLKIGGAINVGLSMTEADVVPLGYTEGANDSGVNALAVPSEWNRKVFQASGVYIPTTVIQPPVDPDLLRMKARSRGDVVEYLSIFTWPSPHKNPKALIEAFCRAFKHDDPVRLTIKTDGVDDERIADDVHEAVRLAGVKRAPRIRVICGGVSRQEILKLYASSDVYVSSHHGEGWGLPIFESMAIGMPAIAPAFSAPLEFMHRRNSYLVGYQYNEELGNVDVDVDELASAMRRTFTDPDEARARGEAARIELCGRFTADRTTEQVLEAARIAAEAKSRSKATSPTAVPSKPLILAIPTLNRYDLCRCLVEHVERTSTRKPDRYLIIDNGGSFDGASLGLGDRLTLHQPRENLGVAASWNYALQFAHPDAHVAIVNDDVMPEPNDLALLYGCAESHRGKAIHARVDCFSFFLQTPETAVEVGYYDEHFWPAYYEDVDYERRLVLAGVNRIDVTPPRRKDPSQTLAGADDALRRTIEDGLRENHDYYCRKWGGPPTEERFTRPFEDRATLPLRSE